MIIHCEGGGEIFMRCVNGWTMRAECWWGSDKEKRVCLEMVDDIC